MAPGFASGEQRGQVEAVDGMQEKQRPHALVEIVALAAEGVERIGFGEQWIEAETRAGGVERRCCGRLRPAR